MLQLSRTNPTAANSQTAWSQVHLLSDLLGKADGVLAFREVLESSPALRALMSETGGAAGDPMSVDESKYRLVAGKLGEREKKKPSYAR